MNENDTLIETIQFLHDDFKDGLTIENAAGDPVPENGDMVLIKGKSYLVKSGIFAYNAQGRLTQVSMSLIR